MFADPLFVPLRVRIGRLVVPWDAMRSRAVRAWLVAARRAAWSRWSRSVTRVATAAPTPRAGSERA